MGKAKIKFLRGTADAISKSTKVLEYGQPLFDNTNKYLYVGDGSSTISSLEPIITSELKYESNNSSIHIYNNKNPIATNENHIDCKRPLKINVDSTLTVNAYQTEIDTNTGSLNIRTPKISLVEPFSSTSSKEVDFGLFKIVGSVNGYALGKVQYADSINEVSFKFGGGNTLSYYYGNTFYGNISNEQLLWHGNATIDSKNLVHFTGDSSNP